MNFDLRTPCDTCPFRTDVAPFLRQDRGSEIADALRQDKAFACHKTVEHDDDGERVPRSEEQHCAGALILLERAGQPNQLMRIAERLDLYDRTKLDTSAPVFETLDDFVDAQEPDTFRRKAPRKTRLPGGRHARR